MDIQKAAGEYLKTVDLNEQMSITGRVDIIEAFLAGAEYQRNSVWHDMTELPEKISIILLYLRGEVYCAIFEKRKRVYVETSASFLKDRYEWDRMPFERWCYQPDIFPTNK